MQNLKDRFEHCDPRFFNYLDKVLQRLPQDVKKEILDHQRFQILADEAFHEACVLRHRFEDSVEKFVYLNTKLLRESEHRIILIIAHEIAMVIAGKTKGAQLENEAQDLLIQWGFDKELESVRYDQIIANSEGYKAGYKWAIHQDKDYLLQHFGLYFDEWNKMGWRKRPEGALQMLDQKSGKEPIFKDLSRFMDLQAGESDDEAGEESPSQRQAIFTGILTAVKEIELREQHSLKGCEVRY